MAKESGWLLEPKDRNYIRDCFPGDMWIKTTEKATAKKIAERLKKHCLGETRSSYHFEISIKEWQSLLKEIEES